MPRILGIDPGLGILGWSVVDHVSSELDLVDFGVLRTEAHKPLTDRLIEIYSDLQELISRYKPTIVAIETLFFVKNAKTLAQVGHVRGIVLLAAGLGKTEVFEYTPRQIKLALTGFGGAEKNQMQTMVKRVFKLKEVPQPDDAADAVAIALCHTQYATTMGRSMVTV